MKICGILLAKKNSKRFPGKNRLLWRDNAQILIDCLNVKNVYMLTDDAHINIDCDTMGINLIDKTENIDDEMSYLDVLRFAYMSIDKKYDIIVTILCNSIGHTTDAIYNGIGTLMRDPDADEVRSFDENGNQSGIFIFRADRLPEKWHHIASIVSNGKEIHYEGDLEK